MLLSRRISLWGRHNHSASFRWAGSTHTAMSHIERSKMASVEQQLYLQEMNRSDPVALLVGRFRSGSPTSRTEKSNFHLLVPCISMSRPSSLVQQARSQLSNLRISRQVCKRFAHVGIAKIINKYFSKNNWPLFIKLRTHLKSHIVKFSNWCKKYRVFPLKKCRFQKIRYVIVQKCISKKRLHMLVPL